MVLDLMLPGMDGIELLDKVAEDDSIEKPRVVIYSAKDLTYEERIQINGYRSHFIHKHGRSVDRVLETIFIGASNIAPVKHAKDKPTELKEN